MSLKFVMAVFITSLFLVSLLALAFYLGMRYHSGLMLKGMKLEPSVEKTAVSTSTPPERQRTLPTSEMHKYSLEKPKSVKFADQNTPLELSIGESVIAGDTTILFSDVVYDERCPEEVDCYTAGEAIVEILLRIKGQEHTVYLSSLTGGKSNYWADWKFKEDYADEMILADIAEMQSLAQKTTYVGETTRRNSSAVVQDRTIQLKSLTPERQYKDGPLSVSKETYRATFVIGQ